MKGAADALEGCSLLFREESRCLKMYGCAYVCIKSLVGPLCLLNLWKGLENNTYF